MQTNYRASLVLILTAILILALIGGLVVAAYLANVRSELIIGLFVILGVSVLAV